MVPRPFLFAMTVLQFNRTLLPCGAGCEAVFQLGGKKTPSEIHLEAIAHGWSLRTVNGEAAIVCRVCKKKYPR